MYHSAKAYINIKGFIKGGLKQTRAFVEGKKNTLCWILSWPYRSFPLAWLTMTFLPLLFVKILVDCGVLNLTGITFCYLPNSWTPLGITWPTGFGVRGLRLGAGWPMNLLEFLHPSALNLPIFKHKTMIHISQLCYAYYALLPQKLMLKQRSYLPYLWGKRIPMRLGNETRLDKQPTEGALSTNCQLRRLELKSVGEFWKLLYPIWGKRDGVFICLLWLVPVECIFVPQEAN